MVVPQVFHHLHTREANMAPRAPEAKSLLALLDEPIERPARLHLMLELPQPFERRLRDSPVVSARPMRRARRSRSGNTFNARAAAEIRIGSGMSGCARYDKSRERICDRSSRDTFGRRAMSRENSRRVSSVMKRAPRTSYRPILIVDGRRHLPSLQAITLIRASIFDVAGASIIADQLDFTIVHVVLLPRRVGVFLRPSDSSPWSSPSCHQRTG